MPFQKGQSGNPSGRPKKAREQRYYEITQSTVTFEDWREIVARAVQDAKRGDTAARKWLADYLIGTPEQNVSIVADVETRNTVFDYSAAIVAIAPGPTGDSETPGENQGHQHGEKVG